MNHKHVLQGLKMFKAAAVHRVEYNRRKSGWHLTIKVEFQLRCDTVLFLFFSQNALLYGLWYCSSVLRLSCNTRHSLGTRVALFLERQSDPFIPIFYYPSRACWDNRKGSTSLQATSSSTEWSRQNGLTKPYHQFKTSQSMLYPSGPQPVAYQLSHDYNSQHAGSCNFAAAAETTP